MAWYNGGTVALTNGNAAVIGTGTQFIANVDAGEAFLGPDDKLYEITGVVSNTELTLAVPYEGATASGQAYAIVPVRGRINELTGNVATLLSRYADIADNLDAGRFGDGTVAAPGISFIDDTDTGIRRTGSNAFALVAGGADRVTVGSNGINIVSGTVGAPAFGFISDPDTGFYSIGANQLGLSVAGVLRATFGVASTDFTHNLNLYGAANPTLRLAEGASTTSYFDVVDVSATQANIQKTVQTGGAILDLNPVASDGASHSSVRVGRNTTSGISLQIMRGNNSADVGAQIHGEGNSYVNAFSGNFGIGISAPDGKLHVAGNKVIHQNAGQTRHLFKNTSAGADLKGWDILADGADLYFRGINDADSSGNSFMQVTKGGIANKWVPTRIAFSTAGAERLVVEQGGQISGLMFSAQNPGVAGGAKMETSGGTANTGYFSVYTSAGVRRCYIGHMTTAALSPLNYNNDDGGNHLFAQSIVTLGQQINVYNGFGLIQHAGDHMYIRPTNGGGSTLYFGANNANLTYLNTGSFGPIANGGLACGAGGNRWSEVYAVNGSINTSDEREKTWRGSISFAEFAAAKEIVDVCGFYQWNDAIALKGPDGARYHFGPKAQQVWGIMAAHGLIDPIDPETGKPGATPYAFLCYDEWDEQTEPVMEAFTIPGGLDPDGNPLPDTVQHVNTGETRVTLAAGNRFGIRPDQLSMFVATAQAQRINSLETLCGDLLARIEALEA